MHFNESNSSLLRGPLFVSVITVTYVVSFANAAAAQSANAPPSSAPVPVSAGATADASRPNEPVEGERRIRDGVVLGTSWGFGLAGASGYPNDVRLVENRDYYGATPALPGYSFNFFFMGAIAPYLNIGFWGGAATFSNADWKSVGGGGGLRAEVFPLMPVCACVLPKAFSNYLGVYGMVGLGATSTDVKRPGSYETIGGVQSYLAAGAFYEFKLGRLLAIGPDLRYEAVASRTSDRNALVAGFRLAFYPGN
jgi:hypothetical protein